MVRFRFVQFLPACEIADDFLEEGAVLIPGNEQCEVSVHLLQRALFTENFGRGIQRNRLSGTCVVDIQFVKRKCRASAGGQQSQA